MARATREQSEATAATVVQAARRLFADRGYAAVGLEEVASEARVTRGAVYHHFSNKAGLFAAVHAAVQQGVGEAIESSTAGVADPWQSLLVGCRAFLEVSVADDTRRIMLVDAPAVVGWSEWRRADAENAASHLGDVLRDLESAGRIDVAVPAAAALLSGAMNEAALWIAESPDRSGATEEAWIVLRRMLEAMRTAP